MTRRRHGIARWGDRNRICWLRPGHGLAAVARTYGVLPAAGVASGLTVAMAQRPVTLADIVSGHVSLEIETGEPLP